MSFSFWISLRIKAAPKHMSKKLFIIFNRVKRISLRIELYCEISSPLFNSQSQQIRCHPLLWKSGIKFGTWSFISSLFVLFRQTVASEPVIGTSTEKLQLGCTSESAREHCDNYQLASARIVENGRSLRAPSARNDFAKATVSAASLLRVAKAN